MHNGLNFIFTFSAGAAIGAVVAWKLTQTKYNQLIQEEIDSVKESFAKMYKSEETVEEKTDIDDKIGAVKEYSSIADNYTSKITEKGGSDDMEKDKPYVISPDEYGENDDYDVRSFVLYTDGVLADENDNAITAVDDIIGEESLDHFGDYEEDSVFVRNDRLKCDYEILKDYRPYSDLYGTDESPTDDE